MVRSGVSGFVVFFFIGFFCDRASGQPRFQGLGSIPWVGESTALAVSADGHVVVGTGTQSGPGDIYGQAFRWTREGGIQMLNRPPAPYDGHSAAFGVSADGTTVIGHSRSGDPQPAFTYRAFRWTAENGSVWFTDPTIIETRAYALSPDGSFAVGWSWRDELPFAALWRDGQEIQLTPAHGVAYGVSADGLTVVGASGLRGGPHEAFTWTEKNGFVALGDLDGGPSWPQSIAYAASGDGAVVVGVGTSANGWEAFRYKPGTGMIGLGDLPGGRFYSEAYAVSCDGSVVVGRSMTTLSYSTGFDAFIWDAEHGIRFLRDVLITEHGFNLDGWRLVEGRAISADGSVIVGTGVNAQGRYEAWIARLGPPCPADWNQDGVLNSQDFFDFLCDFFADAADFDGSGRTDSADLFTFLDAWSSDCP